MMGLGLWEASGTYLAKINSRTPPPSPPPTPGSDNEGSKTNVLGDARRGLVREEGGKRVKQWQARALAIKHYPLDKCIIHPMNNAISFLNSCPLDIVIYLVDIAWTTDQLGQHISLSCEWGGEGRAVSPAVHLHSVASQLICLLKLYVHSF